MFYTIFKIFFLSKYCLTVIMRMNKRYIIWAGLIFVWAFPINGEINTLQVASGFI